MTDTVLGAKNRQTPNPRTAGWVSLRDDSFRDALLSLLCVVTLFQQEESHITTEDFDK